MRGFHWGTCFYAYRLQCFSGRALIQQIRSVLLWPARVLIFFWGGEGLLICHVFRVAVLFFSTGDVACDFGLMSFIDCCPLCTLPCGIY